MTLESNFFTGKVIIVTGGAGSIGSWIVKTLLKHNPEVVRILDNNETGLFDLEQELDSDKIRVFLGDIRDKERIKRALENVDIIFHSAALKHVPLCEYNPFEAIKTNTVGTQNLIEAAMDEEVERLITISTDKAVNPINVMGATKLLAERLTISANFYKGVKRTIFSCVRFGNVLNTRGSVIPLFKRQIQDGFVTITDPDMTRFMMEIPKAVDLVLKAAEIACGGEIFIFKMHAIRMMDIAEVMVESLAHKNGHHPDDVAVQIIGKRAGEKMYEELMTPDEADNAYEDDAMFVVLPPMYDIVGCLTYDLPDTFKKTQQTSYSSKDADLLTKEEIRTFLKDIV